MLLNISGKFIKYSCTVKSLVFNSSCYCNYREAWNAFKGFPKNNAALAYVYIVQQLVAAGDSSDGKSSGPTVDCFGAIVSTLK